MHLPRACLFRCVISICFAIASTIPLFAQPAEKFEKVPIKTRDGVELQGYWYASVPKAPVALLLHDITSDSQRREWNGLAEKLQASGYAVLAFDFRGHGQSTAVNKPIFQSYSLNRGIKVTPGGVISYKTFQPAYVPVFVNDIAAAKSFLDTKHDGGHCNSSNLILIGAGQGATLGALWLKSEWYRFKWIPPQPTIGIPGKLDYESPMGQKVIAAIWLSYSHRLGTSKSLKTATSLLKRATFENATPTVFVYNPEIKDDATIAKYCVKQLKKSAKKYPKHEFTGSMAVKNADKLRGRELLDPAYKVPDQIVTYLSNLKKKNRFAPNHIPQEFQRTQYFWWVGRNQQPQISSLAGEDSFRFFDYRVFLPLP